MVSTVSSPGSAEQAAVSTSAESPLRVFRRRVTESQTESDPRRPPAGLDRRWLTALRDGLSHSVYELIAERGGLVVGRLPVALVSSALFGRFLVSLPYINSAGLETDDSAAASGLIDEAVDLARELRVRYLEIRQERELTHPLLTDARMEKVLMRRPLPATADELWADLDPKVRNQIRKGQKSEFQVMWGGADQLDGFYDVFARNMRDLGTPVFGKRLFSSILRDLGADAELCVVRDGAKPVAAALLIHDADRTEVPSASALFEYRASNVNMLMYWHLLGRAIERGQAVFDFGRSSVDGNTYRFKKQWGAAPSPSVWQYHVLQGSRDALRPDNPGNRRLIEIWKRLPVWLTRCIGPSIVRGIP